MIRFLLAVGTPIAALAIFAAQQSPVLYLYYAGVVWFLFGAGGIASAFMQGGRVVELEKKLGEANQSREALESEAMDLHLKLTEAEIAAGTVRVPLRALPPLGRQDLRVVPPQRVSDDDWFARLYDEKGNHRG